MAQKFLTDIELTRGLKDSSGDLGTSGQVLSSTGSALNWIDNTASASVVYQDGFTGDGSTTAFTLANSIDNENKTQVYIDGVYQHKDTYSLSGTTLTFSTAPPNTSDIEVISFKTVTADGDILTDSEFSSAGLMKTNGSGVYSIVTDNSSNWNTAYTYSQVGHLPLAGGTLTGDITISGGDITLGTDSIASNINSLGDVLVFNVDSNANTGGTPNMQFKVSGTTELTLNSTTATFAGNIEMGSNSIFTQFIKNNASVRIDIDTDNNQTDRIFVVSKHNAGTELFRVQEDGNVGIGTTSPSSKLNVNSGTVNNVAVFQSSDGNANIRVADSNATVQIGNNSGKLILGADINSQQADSYISFEVDGGSEKMRLNASGNLGIGTISPSHSLHVVSAGNGEIKAERTSGAAILTQAQSALGRFGTTTNHNLQLMTNSNTGITINTSGSVGIGTTSPSQKLDVVGSSGDTNIRVYDASANSEVGIKLQGDAKTWTLQNWGSGGDNLRLLNNAGNIVQLWDDNGKVAIGNFNDPDRTLDVRGDGMSIYGTGDYTELMLRGQVEGTGTVRNVGAFHWSIRGDVGGDNDDLKLLRFVTGSYAGIAMQVQNSTGDIFFGNTVVNPATGFSNQRGLGYDNSTGNLQVASTSGQAFIVGRNETSDGAIIELRKESNIVGTLGSNTTSGQMLLDISGSSSNGNIRFVTNGAEVMRITSAYKVGIGLTSPAVKLEIQDSTHTTMKIRSGNNDNILFAQAIQSSDARIGTDTNTDLSFYSNGSERMRITSNGEVCVGNTNVTGFNETFNVTGYGIATENTNGGNRGIFGFFGGTPLIIGTGDNVDVVFRTDNTERMRVHGSTGRVSIGSTTASANTLTLSGTGTELDLANTSTNGRNFRIASVATGDLEIIDKNANQERLKLDSSGVFTFTSPQAIGVVFKTTDTSYGAMNIYKDHTNTTRGAAGYNASAMYFGGELNTNTILQAGGQVGLYINNSTRNVGIGTTSPSYKLEVNGGTALVGGGFYVSSDQSIVTSSTYTFRDGVYINNPNSTSAASTSNSVMSIGASSGNSVHTSLVTTGAVGIGTSSPTSKLTIDNGSDAGGSFLKSSSSSYTAHFIANTGSGNAGIYCDASNGDFIGSDYVFFGQHNDKWAQISSGPSASGIRFMPADNIKMVINNSGNVGIGTSSPIAQLDVAGNINQHHSASTTHNGGWRNIQNLGSTGWLDQTYSAGRIKVFGYENSNVNVSYCEYYVIRSSAGYHIQQIGTRLDQGNTHGHVEVQVSGSYLQVRNVAQSSLGAVRIVFSGMKD